MQTLPPVQQEPAPELKADAVNPAGSGVDLGCGDPALTRQFEQLVGQQIFGSARTTVDD